MQNKKIFILLPDGIGLRNFAYSDFQAIGLKENFDVVFWNNTPFDLTELGFKEIRIHNSKSNPFTEGYKNARKQIELNLNIRKTQDRVYDTYRFPFSYATVLKAGKSLFTQMVSFTHSSKCGLNRIREKIKNKERRTLYYHKSLETLQKEKPAMVFCTNQRPMSAIAPLLAAQDLGIPTATFIFSWDNLPKATMVVETDYYFVWSDLMKKELLFYYPYILESQIVVTGTPQFESHFDKSKLISREDFFEQNNLNLDKKYICYSGDDITTCPDDSKYLEDVAVAVRELNRNGNALGIIFRRCPVDFSDRYDKVINDYQDVIVPIEPLWQKIGEGWNTILPTQVDIDLQMNTIANTEMVVNLGSSMVFDYVAHDKACAFINYDVTDKKISDWSVKKIYNYVHFRSMPNLETVLWINNPDDIVSIIESGIDKKSSVIDGAQEWFKIINQHSPQEASKRIWEGIKIIIYKE
ncbi:UDP-glycosyltransferase [Flavobacterium tyrosinilyticum]|uniref:UDP-glycosyltransferase n=1 Tax=Flavobacterium tyrosinilyticum TaxID=1658740 RepID=UPI00202E7FEC|nr:UDP-glycosyltransferase [Flavobacterium tyrosinilyticum]MCM0668632.1 UDP-glycosyltransferase [Flavobacterium tyrosinilyticum]